MKFHFKSIVLKTPSQSSYIRQECVFSGYKGKHPAETFFIKLEIDA